MSLAAKATRIVSGRALLCNASALLALVAPANVVHQTMRESDLWEANSWTRAHPLALHVRWSDADNRALIEDRYPEYLWLHDRAFRLPVQRTDLARILYLHAFGGLYADADYEYGGLDIFEELRTVHAPSTVLIVRSPVLLNEVMQNSLMYARHARHPFFRACADHMAEVFAFLDRGCDFSSSCQLVRLFHHPLTRDAMHTLFTVYMTGPNMLDKTAVLHPDGIGILPCERWFFGGERGDGARHRHDNSWIRPVAAAGPAILVCGLLLAMAALLGGAIATAATRRVRVTVVDKCR